MADLSDRTREELLALMEHDEAEEVRDLLAYPEDSAGGLMTTEFVAVPADADDGRDDRPPARARARRRDDLLRLRRRRRRAAGRRPVAARPDRRAAGDADRRGDDRRARRRPRPRADRDDVAEIVAHYNLLAVPVVDDERRLVGIVTVDDAIDTDPARQLAASRRARTSRDDGAVK